jgi:hypothetical protein
VEALVNALQEAETPVPSDTQAPGVHGLPPPVVRAEPDRRTLAPPKPAFPAPVA